MNSTMHRTHSSQKGLGNTLSSSSTSQNRLKTFDAVSSRTRPASAGYGVCPDGPPDPRQHCSSQGCKFYAWEVSRPGSRVGTAQTDLSRPQTGISALTNGELPMTGRRKKVECLLGTDLEILLGLDVLPVEGQRVMVSSRGKDQKVQPPGNPCAGTVTKVLEGGLYSVVKWDNGTGPFQYATSQQAGLQLTALSATSEPPKPERRPAVTAILHKHSEEGAKGEVLREFFDTLELHGHAAQILDEDSAAGDPSWGATLPLCKVCVVVLDRPLVESVQRSGALKSLIEYAAQVLGDKRVIFLSLLEGTPTQPARFAAANAIRTLGGPVAMGLHRAVMCSALDKNSAKDAAMVAVEQITRRS